MNTVRRKCRNAGGYTHYFEPLAVHVGEPEPDGSWDREILLICSRCGLHLYVDSVVRTTTINLRGRGY